MSEIFDSIQVSDDVKRFVDHSFDVVDQIHEILDGQGKTQRDLADLLGKKESEISKWMRGTHNFTLKSISKIEAALGEKIITTPLKAEKEYSKVKMVPVVVEAKANRKPESKVELTNAGWGGSGKVYKHGLKSA